MGHGTPKTLRRWLADFRAAGYRVQWRDDIHKGGNEAPKTRSHTMNANTITAASITDTTDAAEVLVWTSADGQREINLEGMPAWDALEMLLEECGDNADREAIMAGSFELA